MAKVCRVFLRPGNLGFIDVTPTADFNFPAFVMAVRCNGFFMNDGVYIPADSVQCMIYNEPDQIVLLNADVARGKAN